MYSSYILTQDCRKYLLERFPPKYGIIHAHHITYKYPDNTLPKQVQNVEIIGYIYDRYCETFVVSIDGSTERPDGNLFHITWSTNLGTKPVYSNQLVGNFNYQHKLEESIPITVTPAVGN